MSIPVRATLRGTRALRTLVSSGRTARSGGPAWTCQVRGSTRTFEPGTRNPELAVWGAIMNAAGAAVLGDGFTEEQIRAMPTYSWDVARVGDTAAPFTYGVTAESIAAYCEAVRNQNPLYLDPAAASKGPFGDRGPPTYAFMCAPLRRNEVMHTRGFASPEEKSAYQTPYSKSELKTYRPIFAGESVYSFVYLAEKYERRGNCFMTWKVKAVNGRQMPASTTPTPLFGWTDPPRAAKLVRRLHPSHSPRSRPRTPYPP